MQVSREIAVQSEKFEIGTAPDDETRLGQEIQQLWHVHSQTQTVLGHTKEELRALRRELGRRLHEMKVLLASPGRAGKWSKFLSEQRIPRASADRYARSYGVTLNPPVEIASTEAIQDSAEERVHKVVQNIWPKLRDVLTDPEAVYQFLCALVRRCNTLQAEITDSGIAIRKPTTISSEPSSDVLDTKNAVEGQGAGHEYE